MKSILLWAIGIPIPIIILLAILTSIIVPSYSRYWHRTRFQGAVNDIADLIADARERAITKDTQTTLSYLGGTQTFKLEVTPPTPSSDMPTAMSESGNPEQQTGGGIRGYQLREDTLVQEFAVGGGGGGTPSPLSAKQEQSLHFREDVVFPLRDHRHSQRRSPRVAGCSSCCGCPGRGRRPPPEPGLSPPPGGSASHSRYHPFLAQRCAGSGCARRG